MAKKGKKTQAPKKFSTQSVKKKVPQKQIKSKGMDWRLKFATKDIKWMLLSFLLIIIATAACYQPALDNEFTNWDDHKYVHENLMLGSDYWKRVGWTTMEAIDTIAKTPVAANHHPVTMLSLAWNYNNFQPILENGKIDLQPKPFIITNISLHIVVAFLIFILIYLLTQGSLLIAFVSAFLFAIHPMHVESVAWIAARKDPLYTFFFIGAIIAFLGTYVNKRKWIWESGKNSKWLWYFLALVLFAFSCGAKPAAVVLPLVLMSVDYYVGRIDSVKSFIMSGIEKIPFFAISIYDGLLTKNIQEDFGAIGETEIYDIGQKILFASSSLIRYVAKFFAPYELSTFYAYPPISNIPTFFKIAPFIVIPFLILFFYLFRKNKHLIFGMLFFIINLILVLQFLSVGNAIMSERYTYVPYIGLAFIVGYLIDRAWKVKKFRAIFYPAIVVLALGSVAFVAAARTQSDVWQNSGSLWTQVVDRNPRDFTARYNRGLHFSKVASSTKDENERKRLFEIALSDYELAVKIRPNSYRAHVNRGTVYRSLDKVDKAIRDFTKAISINKSEASPTSNPDWRLGYANRASVFYLKGRYLEAIEDLQFLYDNTGDTKVLLNIANNRLYAARQTRDSGKLDRGKKMYEQSIAEYTQILLVQPKNGEAVYNRSVAYGDLGRKKKALEDALLAQSLGRKIEERYLDWLKK